MSIRRTMVLATALTLAAGGASAARRSTEATVRLSRADADAAEPAIVAAPRGGAYVAWVEHRGDAADVMTVSVDRRLRPTGAPVRVDPTVGSATAWRGDPPTLAVGSDGTLYVGWTAKAASETGHATTLYLSSSHDGGKSYGAPVRVNDDDGAPAEHGMHSLAVGRDGRVVVAWLDERNAPPKPAGEGHHMEANREVWIAASTDGGRTFGANHRVATDVCPCCKTALAVAPDGRIYCSWRQVLDGGFRHIAVASSTDGGASFGSATIVSDDAWRIDGCPVSGAALATPGPSELRAVWYSAGSAGPAGLYAAESHDAGRTFGARSLVLAAIGRGTPSLVARGGSLAAVWESGDREPHVVATPAFPRRAAKTFATSVAGELPAAVAIGDRVVAAFVVRDGARRSIVVSDLGASR